MEQRLKNYTKYMEELLKKEYNVMDCSQQEKILNDLLVQIGFFQHERIVHLIVTVMFALLTMLSLLGCFVVEGVGIYILLALFVVLLVPYIRHYYILENGVQKLYKIYDNCRQKSD